MRSLSVLVAAGALALAGCIGVEAEIEVLGADSARMAGVLQMQRGIYEMAGGEIEFCGEGEDGVLELTDANAICRFEMTGSFDDLFGDDDPDPGALPAGIALIAEGVARVTIPLTDLTDDSSDMLDDPAMLDMVRPMFAGYEIAFVVRGAEILESNGTIADDRRSARFAMPIVDLLDPDLAPPDAFVTDLRF